jgi:hypothetical protein
LRKGELSLGLYRRFEVAEKKSSDTLDQG